MRILQLFSSAMVLSLLFVLVGCGGGGGGGENAGGGSADAVTLARDGASSVYTETAALSNLTGYDPYIHAYYHPASNRTFLFLYTNYTGGITTGTFNEIFEMHFGTSSPGVYTVGIGSTFMAYSRQLPSLVVPVSSGTITVTSYGAVGERIEGVYSGVSGTRTLSGSFSVTREANSP